MLSTAVNFAIDLLSMDVVCHLLVEISTKGLMGLLKYGLFSKVYSPDNSRLEFVIHEVNTSQTLIYGTDTVRSSYKVRVHTKSMKCIAFGLSLLLQCFIDHRI